MAADTATRHKSACILCENNRGIQIRTDARRFAKIRGAEEHVAPAGYTLIGLRPWGAAGAGSRTAR